MRVLVVDDSTLYRKIISDALALLPDIQVLTAPSGSIALSMLEAAPVDLVLLDIHMPDMSGPEVLEVIVQKRPRTPVVMFSGGVDRDASVTIRALQAGALDFIQKPNADSMEEGKKTLQSQLRRVVDLARLRMSAAPAPSTGGPPRPRIARVPQLPEVLLIGSSTGGPTALQEVLTNLPANFPVPILVVQHMPPKFTATLAAHIDRLSPLRVSEVVEGHAPKPGEVLIAPGGQHFKLARNAAGHLLVRLTDDPPVNSCRPSVDVLFESAAACGLRGVISVILTGMGDDGANGVAALREACPTWCIIQNAATCVVYGMPAAIERRHLEDQILPLPDIAPRLQQIFRL
jgi:two-component system, chemotaxis family, protein-glutamate methylesterase/glutaminase